MGTKNLQVAKKTFNFLQNTKARTNLLVGGAGSSKSWQVAIHLLLKMFRENNITLVVIRKTLPALKISCYRLMLDLLKQLEIPYALNKAEMAIQIGTNTILFKSIDDIEKLKSIERINYIWCEESTEISEDDYMQLDLRVRGANENGINQLFYTFNPTDYNSFLRPLCQNPPKDTAVCHSTFRDNPFLSKEYRQRIEELINIDDTYYKIYNQGEWANIDTIVYTKWDICRAADWPAEFEDTIYGLDFGFSASQTALIEINKNGMEVWEKQLIYETGLTNTQLIAKLQELEIPKEATIVADSARPDLIQEIYDAGYFIEPCVKGQGSKEYGIDVVKRFVTHLHEDSVDLIREKKMYKYKKDKDGHILSLTVKFEDHLMDAERYGLSKYADIIPGLFPLENEKQKIDINVIEIDDAVVDAHRWKMMCED